MTHMHKLWTAVMDYDTKWVSYNAQAPRPVQDDHQWEN